MAAARSSTKKSSPPPPKNSLSSPTPANKSRCSAIFPVPVEVITFALPLVRREIEQLGAAVVLRQKNGKPFVTDEGHHILDCHFGRIPDPPTLSRKLSDIPGIVEHGLFINRASVVIVAHGDKVTELHRSK